MKVNYEIVQQRRDDIMVLIQKLGKVDVETLSNEFNTSEITIRRDLQYWEDRGAIIRYHGGAKLVQHMVNHNNTNFTNDRYKHALAKYAAQFVEEGDTIFINTSSTALLILLYIQNKRVTVITNNAKALLVKHDPLISIVLTGGELRFPKEAMVGEFCLNNLNRVSANKCFIGCSGISADDGITTAIQNEVSINETMIHRTTGSVFVLADYTKIGTKHSFLSGQIDDIDYLITDINAPQETLEEIAKHDVKITQLKPLIRIDETQ
ncbi:DeoR/GlpR family DNA-binding transcription regulator [Anaerorhabdus sp.]|jgi:DeoR family transcriptional regulator, fructose operon transcriptional repressor|uniref:DeoR/GlpR family DNA-binding transcription regulator n=1 Tax=Anaerorhabdus sp. TaxID=1872524 RepID=UPI002FCC00FC